MDGTPPIAELDRQVQREVEEIARRSREGVPADPGPHTQALLKVLGEESGLLAEQAEKTLRANPALQFATEWFLVRISQYSPETYAHSLQVARYTARFGVSLVDKPLSARSLPHDQRPYGYIFSLDEIVLAALAAPLHDFGKLYIDTAILHHPGKLSTQQIDVMRRHVVYSEQILRALPLAESTRNVLSRIIGTHHENLDGSGYPQGLGKEQLPYLARLLPIADQYEALTADRIYGKVHSPAEAGTLLRRWARQEQIDRNLVNRFLTLIPELKKAPIRGRG